MNTETNQILESRKTQIAVHSDYLNKDILINDDCGCKTGGFYEKEITQHGFHGAIAWQKVFIYCDQCNKVLASFPKNPNKE